MAEEQSKRTDGEVQQANPSVFNEEILTVLKEIRGELSAIRKLQERMSAYDPRIHMIGGYVPPRKL